MNRIVRNLIIAVPLATAGLTLATPGLAMAVEPGPVIIMPVDGDPKPLDIANPTPAPQPEPGPQVPDDKAPAPQPEPQPQPNPGLDDGPGEITDVPDCTHGCDEEPDFPLDQGCFEGCDLPEEPQDQGCFEGCDLPEEPKETTEVAVPQGDAPATDSFTTPTRVDAGLADAASEQGANGLDLTWLLVGGAVVTATGAAFAARARTRASA